MANPVWTARVDDLDRPLHRIFPVWHLEETVRLRRLALVKPSLWLDPREDPAATFVIQRGSKQEELAPYLATCWAQCWSYEANSDVLLRAYSRVALDPIVQRNTDPAGEGVRVTTTARKLIAAVEQWARKLDDQHFFLARVNYQSDDKFAQNLANLLSGPEGPDIFRSPKVRAESLFVKRAMFQQEDEVRLLCIGSRKLSEGGDVMFVPIDPNELFTEFASIRG